MTWSLLSSLQQAPCWREAAAAAAPVQRGCSLQQIPAQSVQSSSWDDRWGLRQQRNGAFKGKKCVSSTASHSPVFTCVSCVLVVCVYVLVWRHMQTHEWASCCCCCCDQQTEQGSRICSALNIFQRSFNLAAAAAASATLSCQPPAPGIEDLGEKRATFGTPQ